jgi:hypothetical protein
VTSDIIRSFNRDTAWLATGVLSALIFAALVIAVKERQANTTQAGCDPLPNASFATIESVVPKSSNSNGTMNSESVSSVDHVFTEASLQEIPASQMEPAASTPISAPAFTPQKNRDAHGQDSRQALAPKASHASNRSSGSSRYVGVKRRLIELWHQSLAKSEKSRSWTAFSNLNSGARRKAAYTARTND